MIQIIIVNGLLYGGIYATLSIGFALMFGVAKLLNLAYPAFYMLCSFLIYIGTSLLGIPLYLSIPVSIIITCFLGAISYKLCLKPIREHEITVLIVSVALAILFEQVFLLVFGADYNSVRPFVSGCIEIIGVTVIYQYLFAIGGSLVPLFGLWILLSKTKIGNSIKAVSQDREMASLIGIDVDRVYTITIIISMGFAGIASALVSPIFMVGPFMWTHPLLIVLATSILGGLGSIKGSIIASYVLGFAEVIIVTLIPAGSFLRDASSMAVMIAVLIAMPEGLFGVVFEEERL